MRREGATDETSGLGANIRSWPSREGTTTRRQFRGKDQARLRLSSLAWIQVQPEMPMYWGTAFRCTGASTDAFPSGDEGSGIRRFEMMEGKAGRLKGEYRPGRRGVWEPGT